MVLTIDTWVQDDCTIGRLSYGSFRCLTLELPWKGNQNSISCVPAGSYNARKYDSPKHGAVILLDDVPERTWVEIHAGNFTRQIQGCILVGDSLKYLDGDSILDVTNSKRTLGRLLALLPEYFAVEIRRCGNL